jgi:hypothetical protein
MSCRLYNCPSNWTKEKSSVSVRLKNATSPFLAASTKLFRVHQRLFQRACLRRRIRLSRSGHSKTATSKITKTTKLFFIAFSSPVTFNSG